MRRILTVLGIAGVGLVLVGYFVVPYIASWMMFGWLIW